MWYTYPMRPTPITFEVMLNTGERIRTPAAFVIDVARIHAKQQLLNYNRSHKSNGGVYVLLDANTSEVLERVRLVVDEHGKKSWQDESLAPPPPKKETPRLSYTQMGAAGNVRIEAMLGDRMVGYLILEVDRTKCEIRDRLVGMASHGNVLWTQHVVDAYFEPEFPSLPINAFMYAIRMGGSNGYAIASRACHADALMGYDAREIFTNTAILNLANVEKHGDYYIAAKR